MKDLYRNLPETPGVYLMKDATGKIIYVGKAGNLRRRVSSYFNRPHESRIQKLVSEIAKIDYRKTDSALEALILESKLIKKLGPRFNVREKDDKSFLYFEITKEKFPRVMLVRGKDKDNGLRYGPFTSAGSAREAYKILRRIFPWSVHEPAKIGKFVRPCFDYEIGLCPGTCIGAVSRKEYMKNIGRLKTFLGGEKARIVRSLEKEMGAASKTLEFEKARMLRRQIFALKHIQDAAMIGENEIGAVVPVAEPKRIEGYDISNISGTSAVGSMVVFWGTEPDKNEYRKFRIRTVTGSNDVGMLCEVITRRLENKWPLPDLMLIDGGVAQVNAARAALRARGLRIPVVGLAKGPKRKRNDLVGKAPEWVDIRTLIRVRDEAHRFAIGYHRRLRGARSLA